MNKRVYGMRNRNWFHRAKSLKDGEWVTGFLIPLADKAYGAYKRNGKYVIYPYDEKSNGFLTTSVEVDRDTIEQWTGMCDKEDNMIFENDKIWCIEDSKSNPKEYTATIRFNEYYMCFSMVIDEYESSPKHTFKNGEFIFSQDICDCSKIIGNTHEEDNYNNAMDFLHRNIKDAEMNKSSNLKTLRYIENSMKEWWDYGGDNENK